MTHLDPRELAHRYYAETDREGVKAFRRWLSADSLMRFNNDELIQGCEAIIDFILGRRQGIKSVQHEIVDVVAEADRSAAAVEIIVHYVTSGDARVEVRGSAFLTFEDARVDLLRVFVNPQALIEALAAEPRIS